MIRILKPTDPPEVLSTRGVEARQVLCRLYHRGRRVFKSNRDFQREIYAHDDVKTLLRHSQHDKCCFCESNFAHIQPGDVEHFRPKAGYKQKASDDLKRPGYY